MDPWYWLGVLGAVGYRPYPFRLALAFVGAALVCHAMGHKRVPWVWPLWLAAILWLAGAYIDRQCGDDNIRLDLLIWPPLLVVVTMLLLAVFAVRLGIISLFFHRLARPDDGPAGKDLQE